jgi:hypothetical protein
MAKVARRALEIMKIVDSLIGINIVRGVRNINYSHSINGIFWWKESP